MPNILSPILRPIGLDPSQGYDTAAAGARQAQQQNYALADLQWQRAMAGLQQSQGFTNQLQSLYNSMYGGGGGQAAPGGLSALPGVDPRLGAGGQGHWRGQAPGTPMTPPPPPKGTPAANPGMTLGGLSQFQQQQPVPWRAPSGAGPKQKKGWD
jgi:hypothetical protein